MDSKTRSNFTPRRSFKRIWIIMAGFGIFIPVGLVIYFAAGQSEGLLMAAFGLVPVLFMIYRVLSPGAVYAVGPEGVYVKKGGSKRLIPLSDIRGAAVLTDEQAQGILKQYMAPGVEGQRELDLKQWYRSNAAYGNFVRYCTVPIVEETTSAGNERNIVKFGAKVAGGFIILKVSSGEEFLLSPEDCEGFFKTLSSRTRLSDTSAATSYSPGTDPVRREKMRKTWKWYRWAAFAVTLVVAAVLIFVYLGKEPADTGWMDGDTFRFAVNARIQTYEDDQDARRKELAEAVASGYKLNFISQAAGWYCEEKGIEPDDEQYDALHNVLWDLISVNEPEIIASSYNEDYTELSAEFEISGSDLQGTVKAMLDEALEGVKQ